MKAICQAYVVCFLLFNNWTTMRHQPPTWFPGISTQVLQRNLSHFAFCWAPDIKTHTKCCRWGESFLPPLEPLESSTCSRSSHGLFFFWRSCCLFFFFVKHQDRGELNVSLLVHKNMCTTQPVKGGDLDGMFPKFGFISHGHLRNIRHFEKGMPIFLKNKTKTKQTNKSCSCPEKLMYFTLSH